jgi:hypothetical protein
LKTCAKYFNNPSRNSCDRLDRVSPQTYKYNLDLEAADIGLAHNASSTDRGIMYQFYFEIASCIQGFH